MDDEQLKRLVVMRTLEWDTTQSGVQLYDVPELEDAIRHVRPTSYDQFIQENLEASADHG
ncbi:MAG TPA: hypothetical protein VIY48_06760 [Candidatus Paceibacterota bacterium]